MPVSGFGSTTVLNRVTHPFGEAILFGHSFYTSRYTSLSIAMPSFTHDYELEVSHTAVSK
jgi:hypothetical protein